MKKTKTASSKTSVANTGVETDGEHLSLLLPFTIIARQHIDVGEAALGAETQSKIAKLIAEALERSGKAGGISTRVCDGFFRLEELNEAREQSIIADVQKINEAKRRGKVITAEDLALLNEALFIAEVAELRAKRGL